VACSLLFAFVLRVLGSAVTLEPARSVVVDASGSSRFAAAAEARDSVSVALGERGMEVLGDG
jgi:hypothetical protein